MKVLLSSIGSRGDVQPLLSLALELQAMGHRASLCVPPNFKDWVESFGLDCIPIGPDVKKLAGGSVPNKPVKPSRTRLRQLAVHTVREQFSVLADAAHECDLIIAVGALQIATRSIAEALKIPYVFVAYCPVVLPSPNHPPPKMDTQYSQSLPAMVNRFLWMRDEQRWNVLFRATLNEERAKVGLAPIASVRPHIFTARPWLAADPALAPSSRAVGIQIVQTGAWLLCDRTPLPEHLENFLAKGKPPIYFGFGSMQASEQTSRHLIESARALGYRAVISQGWANLSSIDDGIDCISIGDVNHEKLFRRVAAVVHHGGGGTTTAAVRSGTPQVVVPHLYDQYYWAYRVKKLGVGVSGPTREQMTVQAMVSALRECLRPEMTARVQVLSNRMELHGAQMAAEQLVNEFG
ncbi:glycosyltransferase [Scytonema sp. NUACC26]|uniref:glycosyltransferase n=1 Tax=Scytonema sp. NUACC26 TaxID=3140176 RepID=UPI0034DC95B4